MSALRFPPGDESNPELVERIVSEIETGGPITFARFMELALGTPELGYYASGEPRAGPEGDFLTAPETHPIFGAVLARQIVECWTVMGRPKSFIVREYGAGRGTLARHVLEAVRESAPETASVMTYELSDLSDRSIDDALTALWDQGLDGVVSRAGGTRYSGVGLANELLDALPFHRLIFSNGELNEIYSAIGDGWFADVTGPISDQAAGLISQQLALVEGQRIEVSPAALDVVRSIASELDAGFTVLIDYGYPRPTIHDAGRFPNGTLKTYHRHQVGDDPYRHVGRQDITAHVDFTAVADAGNAAELRTLGLTTQAEFVAGLGIDRVLLGIQERASSADEYVRARSAVMTLLDPSGLGRFRVLVLARGVGFDVTLSGLSFRLPTR